MPEPTERPPGARRAARSSRLPVARWPSLLRRSPGGARAARPTSTRRRTHGLPGTIAMTALGALVPGAGYLYAGRRALGVVVLTLWVALLGFAAWYFGRDTVSQGLTLAFRTTTVRVLVAAGAVGLLVWAFVVLTSYRLVRPKVRPRSHTVAGYLTVAVITLGLATPAVYAGNAALVTADTVDQIFSDQVASATTPQNRTEKDPWGGQDRVNVLLLGGDGGEGRTGVRTDSMILASMDTQTGKTTLFSLPRNMMYAQFPVDSPLHKIYPDGYGRGGSLDPSFYELNAIYGQVPVNYPGVLGKTDNEGADALKEAVSGTLGIPVDYYLLVQLKGFQTVVDAMGGITVNVNEPVAVNGNTDAGIPPTDYIEPGPDEHLDGFHALWFARGRYGADDYQRMDRQRCTISAIVDAADPVNLLSHYVGLAKASRDIVYTDIPRKLGPSFAQLLLKTKDAGEKSVVFRRSDAFDPADPDFAYVHSVVSAALDPPKRKHGSGRRHESEVEKPKNVCAYAPLDGVTNSDGTAVPSAR